MSISIAWKDPTGKDMSYNYNITTDSKPSVESYSGVEMTVESCIQGNCMKSTSKLAKTGAVVTESTRELVNDGKQLEVVMLNHKGDKKVRIYQLYQR